MKRPFLFAWALAAALLAAPAQAATSDRALDAFFDAHPRYEVIPRAYFETETRPASQLEAELHPYAFLPPGTRWYAELDSGTVRRYPATGFTTARCWTPYLSLGARTVGGAQVRLYALEGGRSRLAMRLRLPAIRPTRFLSAYVRGPFTRQASQDWGEDGAWLVLIQQRYRPDFWRWDRPVLYIGGDFNYQHVEGTVRYLRTHGVNALGYKPAYDRDADESMREMAREELPDVRHFLQLATGGRPANLIGLCVGGLYARALAFYDRRESNQPSMVASVTSIGTPHEGSQLADIYNAVPGIARLHRLLTGDAQVHRYKDARREILQFDREVLPPSGLPHFSIVLDPRGRPVDSRYWLSDWPLRFLRASETHRDPRALGTDGLILVEGQAFGTCLGTWQCDHAGMVNDGLASTYFDAYAAHLALVERLRAQLK